MIKTVQLSATELANIVNGFEENSVLPQNCLFIGGAKHMVLQGDQGIVICGKKTFSYAGFEQQRKKFEKPKILLLNVELDLKSEKENAEVRYTMSY
jgi:hypothetical protein